MTALNINELTTSAIDGQGVFDLLMKSVKAHLDAEFTKGRIKGPEYSTVYLGSLDLAMQNAMAFVLNQRKNDLEAQLLQEQIALATQQKANLAAEGLNIPKQGLVIDAQKSHLDSQKLHTDAQTDVTAQQKINLVAEALNIPKQGLVIDAQKLQVEAQAALGTQQKLNLISEELGIKQKTALTTQQVINAATENTVLVAQECKLRAEFDLARGAILKTAEETALLLQKKATEKAQITALGVDADSVIGRQKQLYEAQTKGFKSDAIQKATKLMVDTWNVRRTTDEGTVADATNKLNDATIGKAVTKLMDDVGVAA